MKKLLVLSLVWVCFTGYSQTSPDSVVMTVAGKDIPLSEFVFIARKNGEINLSDSKSVKDYVELFKNFKLKVAEGEALGLDQTTNFKKELDGYRAQLTSSYLSDAGAEEKAARVVYDRGNEVLELSHILFRLPGRQVSKDTVAVYEEAMKAYERLQKGENFAEVGQALSAEDKEGVLYEYVRCLKPMQTIKAFEEAAYSLPVGVVSQPVRTKMGFHLICVHSRKPNPGTIEVAHILIAFPKDSTRSKSDSRTLAEEVYRKAQAGEDFSRLATTYSADAASLADGGRLPAFGPGEMVLPFERAAFALQTRGQLSGIVETSFGYHIIKLVERKDRPSFETEKKELIRKMRQGERNFDLYKGFDDRMKREYGYIFYPEAYAELQTLCNDYFPSDAIFYEKAKDMTKVLMHVNGIDFPQNEFAYYIQRCPFSTKTYAGDFMQEVYNLFVRDIVTTAERRNLETKHPEYSHLMQEYRDGMLLFEVSNREVWSKPAAEQKELEARWIKTLNDKYPVKINWKLLKKLEKSKGNL